MTKYRIISLVIVTVTLSVLAEVFLGGFFSAKLATWSWVQRFRILNPQAPIVINKKEVVRVSDAADGQEAVSKTKTKLSVLVTVQGGQVQVVGGLVNITADGWFVATKTSLTAGPGVGYAVVLSDGRTGEVTKIVPDTATTLVLLKATLENVPVAELGESEKLTPGEKIVIVRGSTKEHTPQFLQSFVSVSQSNVLNQVFRSDYPTRAFGLQSTAPLVGGDAVIHLNGEVVGVWDGAGVVPSGVIASLVNHFFKDSRLLRPAFGFHYKIVNKVESSLTKGMAGFVVVKVDPKSVANGQLLPGDVILQVDNVDMDDTVFLEHLLAQYLPGQTVQLVVSRDGQRVGVPVTAGELK